MERDAEVIEVLNELVCRKPRWGFWKLHDRLRLDGRCINHKRLHRVYCELELNLPRRTRRRVPTRPRRPLVASTELNQIWAIDFMSDVLYGYRWFRTFNVIDEANREALRIEMYGKPRALRLDNGSELTSIAFTEWCARQKIELHFIQPRKPDQNAFIERFNKTYRTEVLDAYLFDSLPQVRQITESWLHEYNQERPHDSLGCVPPLTFMPRKTDTESALPLCA